MALVAQFPNVLLSTLRFLKPRQGAFFILCVFAGAGYWTMSHPPLKLMFLVLLGGFGILVFLLSSVSIYDRWVRHGLRKTFTKLVQYDASPCFMTDLDGAIVYRNTSAIEASGLDKADTLSGEFRSLFANPASILFRLQEQAQRQGGAREDIITRNGHVRLSAHIVDKIMFLWRMETISDRSKNETLAQGLKLPMLVASASGSILFMNDVFRDLYGGRPTHLDRIFQNTQLRTGQVCQIDTSKGAISALISVVQGIAGRQEIYILPAPQLDPVYTIDQGWDFFDQVPMPLLKIGNDACIERSNGMARDLLGAESLEKVHLRDVFEGLGRPFEGWLSEIEAGDKMGATEFLKLRGKTKDTHVQVSLNKAVEDGRTVFVGVMADATEIKSLEAKYVQSQKMEAIGQLAGGVAHDFNNLLTAISGHCDLLLLRHEKEDQDYGDLIQIHQNANRAASLVGQLLAFSRKQTLRPKVLDVQDTMANLTYLLNRLVGEKISLLTRHESSDAAIRVDKRQLEQVMMNLVVNARDAMTDGGEINIETCKLTFQSDCQKDRATVPAGDYVRLSVRDQGTGIPADVQAKIFEPFFTTKRQGEGTGLGLSTVYGIVKQTGGYIFVDSREGEGTQFDIFFPACAQPAEPTEQTKPDLPKAAADHPHDGVVLLVEDEAPVRAFAARALRLRGYSVIEADCAEAALKCLEDKDLQVDLFVTDVVMPGMDGPSWVKIAMQDRPDVKVVFVSGYAEDSMNGSTPDIPQSVFLPKPFSLNDLTDTVQNQLLH